MCFASGNASSFGDERIATYAGCCAFSICRRPAANNFDFRCDFPFDASGTAQGEDAAAARDCKWGHRRMSPICSTTGEKASDWRYSELTPGPLTPASEIDAAWIEEAEQRYQKWRAGDGKSFSELAIQ